MTIFSIEIKEPDVTLTDYLLFIECIVIFFLLLKQKNALYYNLLFLFTGIASFTGGTVHGFCENNTLIREFFWFSTLLSIGAASWIIWILAGTLAYPKFVKIFKILGFLQFLSLSILIFFFTQAFWTVIVHYLPATIFLLLAFFKKYINGEKIFLWGIFSVILSILAAFFQYIEIGIHPTYFNHNAVYHVIQFIAFILLAILAKKQLKIENL